MICSAAKAGRREAEQTRRNGNHDDSSANHPRTSVRLHAHAPSGSSRPRVGTSEHDAPQATMPCPQVLPRPRATRDELLEWNRIVLTCPQLGPIRARCPPRWRRSTQASPRPRRCCARPFGRCSMHYGCGHLAVRWKCEFLRMVRFSASKVQLIPGGSHRALWRPIRSRSYCSPPAGSRGPTLSGTVGSPPVVSGPISRRTFRAGRQSPEQLLQEWRRGCPSSLRRA